MAIFERPYNSLDELHETELELLKKMRDSGVKLATQAAISYCRKHELYPPPWLVKASDEINCDNLRNVAKRRGRSNGDVSRYRQDSIHYARWATVDEIREKRAILETDVEELRKLPGQRARAMLGEHLKLLNWAGTNDEVAFECASILLKGTPARGGPDAMKKSYQRVMKHNKDPAAACRYRILDGAFLRIAGVTTFQPASQGKKILPLYDLMG